MTEAGNKTNECDRLIIKTNKEKHCNLLLKAKIAYCSNYLYS